MQHAAFDSSSLWKLTDRTRSVFLEWETVPRYHRSCAAFTEAISLSSYFAYRNNILIVSLVRNNPVSGELRTPGPKISIVTWVWLELESDVMRAQHSAIPWRFSRCLKLIVAKLACSKLTSKHSFQKQTDLSMHELSKETALAKNLNIFTIITNFYLKALSINKDIKI